MSTVATHSKGMSVVIWGAATVLLAACSSAGSAGDQAQADLCAARLATFDTLDYDVFSNQQWDRVSESHAQNIVVT